MKYFAAFIVATASVFCAALFAQEGSPDTARIPEIAAPAPVPVPAPAPVPMPAAVPMPALVTPPTASAPAPAPALPLPSGPLSRAEMAATTWLAVADAGDYPRSWREAASLLQTSVTQPKWESALQLGRQQLGGMKSRTLKSATFSRTLTGAPDGEYVLIQYETQFEFKPLAIETLTTMKDRDASWKVAGYFIK